MNNDIDPRMWTLQTDRWGSFPPRDYLPAKVRPAVDKLLKLRVKLAEVRQAELDAKAKIDVVEAEEIRRTVDELAKGNNAEVNSKPVEAAKQAHEQSIRDYLAVREALRQVEHEVSAAFTAHKDEALRLAGEAVEKARGIYRDAIGQVAEARKAYHDAADVERFMKDAVNPALRTNVNFTGQRVGNSPHELRPFRDECDPPQYVDAVVRGFH